jgi:hypothetical protein
MRNLFNELFIFRAKENLSAKENFLTESFAYFLQRNILTSWRWWSSSEASGDPSIVAVFFDFVEMRLGELLGRVCKSCLMDNAPTWR